MIRGQKSKLSHLSSFENFVYFMKISVSLTLKNCNAYVYFFKVNSLNNSKPSEK